MGIVKSPGGSIYPYAYKGGEIHCLKYGSFFDKHEALYALMKAEEDFIISTNRKLRIWVDFYETRLTDQIWIEFMESMNRLKDHIRKLAIVGFSIRQKWSLRKVCRQLNVKSNLPIIKFFDDPEDAKAWLVSE
ncbi:hypothetical protein GCM10010912_02930 [Paenibacillus albidus]|uniref:STAS/SEC14 domain-containing protein n=1 Tax=Paenibacillus albidus TaxID=2041023 RepID=A0A917BYE5_9BACL|nr:STAS/SEC14 domain-containing protein [Paenibacillus albidus]GGF61136.1 hypothetical protein GCM10010912_02930 [Paenibacillus albidus]